MPARYLLDPNRKEFSVLLPEHPTVDSTHPEGCHRRRVLDCVVLDYVGAALANGSGDERVAKPGCSDRTIRRRLRARAGAGLAQRLHELVLAQYDRLIGLDLTDQAVDGDRCDLYPALRRLARRQPAR